MSTEYEIQVLTHPNELHDWTIAQYTSFVNTGNVLHDVLFPPASPPTPADVEKSVGRHKATFNSGHNVLIKIVDPVNGKIMGGAEWHFYSEGPNLPAKVIVDYIDDSTVQGKAELQFAQRVMDEFMFRRARDMNMPHGLLHLCFCVPEYERRGVATALVKWGLEKVDKEGWVAFTEASRRGRPVYEKLGFEPIEEVDLRFDKLGDYAKSLKPVHWTYMKRPSRLEE